MYFFYFEDEPVVNNMNSTNLKSITITNLFGRNDVTLQFDKEVNIYIGENGLGKTTILNCVYYVLTKKYDKLFSIVFDEIIIKFKNDSTEYRVNKNDIREYNMGKMSSQHLMHQTGMIEMLVAEYLNEYLDELDDEAIELCIRRISRRMDIPTVVVRQYVYEYINQGKVTRIKKRGEKKNVEKLNAAIDKHITQKIIYLTTYRRIENDFSQLMEKSDRFKDNDLLIRFGMKDVERSIDRILDLIRDNARESFNKMTGVLLKQYSSNDLQKNNLRKRHRHIDKDMLKIIFDRLGNEIDENDRNNIFMLLDNGDIYSNEYSYLLNLILKLIANYEKYKIYDDKIKRFSDTCNKYLNGKKIEYDQSELKLSIKIENDKSLDNIQLSSLSSGEKQIVSLFSKLYLENEKDSIIIIDEPELSISMKWQKMLLPDVMRSENCKLLLTVTHSPFIFDNEFDMDAKEMRYCISAHN